MTNNEDITIRSLGLEGVQTLMEWARLEGWNPGFNDSEIFFNADPEGFIGCFHQEEMIGGGSIVSYEGHFGFMGLFIMKPSFRSSGIGTRLWLERRNRLINRLLPHAAIGMDGVLAMQPFYQKGGFEIAFRDERHELKGNTYLPHESITTITALDHDSVLNYDTLCFGVPRLSFMIPWLHQKNAFAFKFVDENQLKGFAVIRRCHTGYKIGPLFADNIIVAEALLKACLNTAPEASVFIDIPMCNQNAVSLLQQFESKYVFECARMYKGHAPFQPMEKIFGITSFELG